MSYVIRLIELAGHITNPEADLAWRVDQDEVHYVKHYDPWAHNGQGSVVTTGLLEEARHFHTAAEAIRAYCQQTPHGRPLTAYTIEIVSCETDRQAAE